MPIFIQSFPQIQIAFQKIFSCQIQSFLLLGFDIIKCLAKNISRFTFQEITIQSHPLHTNLLHLQALLLYSQLLFDFILLFSTKSADPILSFEAIPASSIFVHEILPFVQNFSLDEKFRACPANTSNVSYHHWRMEKVTHLWKQSIHWIYFPWYSFPINALVLLESISKYFHLWLTGTDRHSHTAETLEASQTTLISLHAAFLQSALELGKNALTHHQSPKSQSLIAKIIKNIFQGILFTRKLKLISDLSDFGPFIPREFCILPVHDPFLPALQSHFPTQNSFLNSVDSQSLLQDPQFLEHSLLSLQLTSDSPSNFSSSRCENLSFRLDDQEFCYSLSAKNLLWPKSTPRFGPFLQQSHENLLQEMKTFDELIRYHDFKTIKFHNASPSNTINHADSPEPSMPPNFSNSQQLKTGSVDEAEAYPNGGKFQIYSNQDNRDEGHLDENDDDEEDEDEDIIGFDDLLEEKNPVPQNGTPPQEASTSQETTGSTPTQEHQPQAIHHQRPTSARSHQNQNTTTHNNNHLNDHNRRVATPRSSSERRSIMKRSFSQNAEDDDDDDDQEDGADTEYLYVAGKLDILEEALNKNLFL